jgi:hypothetical protein
MFFFDFFFLFLLSNSLKFMIEKEKIEEQFFTHKIEGKTLISYNFRSCYKKKTRRL